MAAWPTIAALAAAAVGYFFRPKLGTTLTVLGWVVVAVGFIAVIAGLIGVARTSDSAVERITAMTILIVVTLFLVLLVLLIAGLAASWCAGFGGC